MSLACTQKPPVQILQLVVLGLGVSGFTSFAYEIHWTRSLVFVLGNSTYAMTRMLCVVGQLLADDSARPLRLRVSGFAVAFGILLVPGTRFPTPRQAACRHE